MIRIEYVGKFVRNYLANGDRWDNMAIANA